ncbi:MAG TPA: hypothetical protein VIX82_07520 [Solirubrobacteraceae bacterium]
MTTLGGVPWTSITTLDAIQIGVVEQEGDGPGDYWGSGGSRQLFTDARIVFALLNEARRRAAARLFGVPLDQTSLVTIIALGTLAKAVHDKAAQVAPLPAVPSFGDATIATGVLKELGHLVAGESSREIPLFLPLVGLALVGTLVRPVLRVSFREIKVASHRARVGFDHRYGHLVRRNRPHSRLPN